eukprot:GHVU01208351.1.p1 GENE.GHVU01208351.1~~GHVU01208351.1.p1  ORF type:complete len:257 (+),score=20.90 GHVU01208351.1:693-1463(+)
MLLTCGCNKLVQATNLKTNQTITVGQHDQPVQGVYAYSEKNLVISASWDGMIKLWDMRQQGAAMAIPLQQKIWAMDFKPPLLAAVGNTTSVFVFNLLQPSTTPTNKFVTTLTRQLRSLCIFRDLKGLVVGGIEGRCNIIHFTEQRATFHFKCHRMDENGVKKVYPVNSIDFHLGHVFSTGGADGSIALWDKNERVKTFAFVNMKQPIVDVSFNQTGKLVAYAMGYDWHKGYQHGQQCVNKVMVHGVQENMLRKSPS